MTRIKMTAHAPPPKTTLPVTLARTPKPKAKPTPPVTVTVNVPKSLRHVHEFFAKDVLGSDEWHAAITAQRNLGLEGNFDTAKKLIQLGRYIQWTDDHVLAFM